MPNYDAVDPEAIFIARALRAKMLSPEEEIELAHQMKARGKAGDRARNAIVEAHLKIAINTARKFTWTGIPMIDLIQEGSIGLMQAAAKFEVEKGFRFSTYARWWVFQAIKSYAYEQGREIRIPESQNKKIRAMNAIVRKLSENGSIPTDREVADAMRVDIETVQELAVFSQRPISINLPIGETGDSELGALLPDANAVDPEEEVVRADMVEVIHGALDCLNDRERYVITKRFDLDGEGKQTLEELSQHFDLTRERVRQIQVAALKKLGNGTSQSILGCFL